MLVKTGVDQLEEHGCSDLEHRPSGSTLDAETSEDVGHADCCDNAYAFVAGAAILDAMAAVIVDEIIRLRDEEGMSATDIAARFERRSNNA